VRLIPLIVSHSLHIGGFATVYHGISLKTNHEVAVKVINICIQDHLSQLKRVDTALLELTILKTIRSHPFIMKLHAAFHNTTSCCLILSSMTGGDLRYHIKSCETFTEIRVAYIIAAISSALVHIHSKNIIHRDVKPENILLDHSGIPHLSDFGSSFIIPEDTPPICKLSSGTFPYLAPEVLTPSHSHSFQSDYWSLGITAYEILFHQRPYDRHCPKDFVYFVDNYYSHYWNYLDEMIDDPTREQILLSRNSPVTFSRAAAGAGEGRDLMTRLIYCLPSPTIDTIPHPHHPIHYSFNQDEEPAGLPEDLLTPLPLRIACKDSVTTECRQFFSSILDIRIHKRLGNVYEDLATHPWFRRYGLNFETLSSYKSPFHPNVKWIQKSLFLRESVNNQEQQQQFLQQQQQQQPTSFRVTTPQQPLISTKPLSHHLRSMARSVYVYPEDPPPAAAAADPPATASAPNGDLEQDPSPNPILQEIEEKLSRFSYQATQSSRSSFSLSRFSHSTESINKIESR
jgi:serine/threonine protein kinase